MTLLSSFGSLGQLRVSSYSEKMLEKPDAL